MKKTLPIGEQDFKYIIEHDYLYVDKTQYINKLLLNKYYFLSRPRRFGKSLLISTLKEIFLGNKELFRDLWIYDKIDWQKHPVIHISFSSIGYQDTDLLNAITVKLDEIATEQDVVLTKEGISQRFQELIQKLGAENGVAILIDEYDKPILDYIERKGEHDIAEKNRNILRNFYSSVKDNSKYIHFFFVTGVSKFSKVSIFSELNNLNDITIHGDYACLTGITEVELENYFPEYIKELAKEYEGVYDNIIDALRDKYLGYSWDGSNYVYNPFGLFKALDSRRLGSYWFQTGTPTFLINLIKNNKYTVFDIENKLVDDDVLDKHEIGNLPLVPLLFQTGYLTIKHYDKRKEKFLLGYPNREVEQAFSIHLLSAFNGGQAAKTSTQLSELIVSLQENDMESFLYHITSVFEGLVYPIVDKKEKYYHSIFYLVVKMIGFEIDCEIITFRGRIDAVLKTEENIYIIEFKTGNTKKAIQQIKEKKYPEKYRDDERPKVLIGIDFDVDKKSIVDFVIE